MLKFGLFCFFFSSRRRHTRYWRDWCSDVCSSDLAWLGCGRRCGRRRGRRRSSAAAPTAPRAARGRPGGGGPSPRCGGRRSAARCRGTRPRTRKVRRGGGVGRGGESRGAAVIKKKK